MGRRVTVLVHKGYNLVQLPMVVRATQKLQEQCLAARLSYQAWRGVEDDTARLRKEEQNQGLLALNVGINALCQGSRARSAGKGQDRAMNLGQCRITDIMLNAIRLFFGNPDPQVPQKQPAAAVYVISLFRSVLHRD
jgi:hypothetical protein